MLNVPENTYMRAPSKNLSLRKRYVPKNVNKESSKKSLFNEKTKKDVVAFYEKDGNSIQGAGIRETITKGKIKKRKRYLCDTINNLSKKFNRESKYKISRALFYKLRPFWVVKQKITERNTSLCKTHTNFKYVFDKLKSLKIINFNNVTQFIESICCSTENKDCMYGNCEKCKNLRIFSNSSNEVTWYRFWVTEKVTRPGAKGLLYTVKPCLRKRIFYFAHRTSVVRFE